MHPVGSESLVKWEPVDFTFRMTILGDPSRWVQIEFHQGGSGGRVHKSLILNLMNDILTKFVAELSKREPGNDLWLYVTKGHLPCKSFPRFVKSTCWP